MSAGLIWFGLRDPDPPPRSWFVRAVRLALIAGSAILALIWLRAWGVT